MSACFSRVSNNVLESHPDVDGQRYELEHVYMKLVVSRCYSRSFAFFIDQPHVEARADEIAARDPPHELECRAPPSYA